MIPLAAATPARIRAGAGRAAVRAKVRSDATMTWMTEMTEMTGPEVSRPAPVPAISPFFGRDLRWQLFLSSVLVLAGWVFIRPLGLTGEPGVVTALLVVNSIFVMARSVPLPSISRRTEFLLIIAWALSAVALLTLRPSSVAPAFAYMVSGNVGYRLATRPALGVAVATGGLSMLGLALGQAHGIEGWPWPLGGTVALTVFLGMSNRAGERAAQQAYAAVESARQAAESDRREAQASERAAQAEGQTAVLVERGRIARDIHDVLAHSLSGVSMQLELGEMLLDQGDTDRARAALARAHSIVREGMSEAGRAVQALRTDVLPLPDTLRATFDDALGVVGEIRPVPTAVSQALIRIAQESLTNARRHAHGAGVRATLTYASDEVHLEVINGPARDSTSSPGSGMGLVGMRERVALLGGRVDAGPVTDGPDVGGWRVLAVVPAPAGAPE